MSRLLRLGNEAAWLPLPNYTILTLLGLWLVVLGLGLVLREIRERELAAAPGIGDDSAAVDNGSAEA